MKSSNVSFACVAISLALAFAFGCRSDKDEPSAPSIPVDGRNKFVGHYKVYDTMGVYLYEMEISKMTDEGNDSLFVQNWGDKFNFYVRHENGDQTNGLNITPPFPSYDHDGLRWSFSREPDAVFGTNQLVRDTLRMSYELNNIAFYVEDGVSYFDQVYKEYGVKQ